MKRVSPRFTLDLQTITPRCTQPSHSGEELIGESQHHLLTRWTLLSLAPARAAASPDTDPSSVPAPWPAPTGSGGGGGGADPMVGGGTGGGGGGGGPPDEAGITAVPLGWPGGSAGPEMKRIWIRREAWPPPAHTQGHVPVPRTTTWLHDKWATRGSTKHAEEWETVVASTVNQLQSLPARLLLINDPPPSSWLG